MTLNIPAPSIIADHCFPLGPDTNGNKRYFLPAAIIGVEPGSKLARKVGLKKYRGGTSNTGFVLQSYHLPTELAALIREIDTQVDAGLTEGLLLAAPLRIRLSMEWTEADMMSRMFNHLVPSLMTRQDDDHNIQIPANLSELWHQAVMGLIMMHPTLKNALLEQCADAHRARFSGLDIRISTYEVPCEEPSDAIPSVLDYQQIARLFSPQLLAR